VVCRRPAVRTSPLFSVKRNADGGPDAGSRPPIDLGEFDPTDTETAKRSPGKRVHKFRGGLVSGGRRPRHEITISDAAAWIDVCFVLCRPTAKQDTFLFPSVLPRGADGLARFLRDAEPRDEVHLSDGATPDGPHVCGTIPRCGVPLSAIFRNENGGTAVRVGRRVAPRRCAHRGRSVAHKLCSCWTLRDALCIPNQSRRKG
jgi:hypothetical protein